MIYGLFVKKRRIKELGPTMKNALVTGASRGIGKAIAEALARNGYSLYLICEKNVEMLDELAEDLRKRFGVSVKTYKADVSDFDSVAEVFKDITELDVLVNNAGISYVGLITDMSPEEWNRIVSVNLGSVFNTVKLSVPVMLKKHSGNIINISSVWGNVGASTEVAYSATKGGVNGFTKALAKELAPSNIAVNAIACGFVDTDMNRHLSKEDLAELKNEIPADRFATPADIADSCMAVLFAPSYMTGQIITVDGGWT